MTSPGYFAAARLAIQQRLGALWNQPAQAITLAEIQARIPADSPVTRFFLEADRQAYSRHTTGDIPPAIGGPCSEDALAAIPISTR